MRACLFVDYTGSLLVFIHRMVIKCTFVFLIQYQRIIQQTLLYVAVSFPVWGRCYSRAVERKYSIQYNSFGFSIGVMKLAKRMSDPIQLPFSLVAIPQQHCIQTLPLQQIKQCWYDCTNRHRLHYRVFIPSRLIKRPAICAVDGWASHLLFLREDKSYCRNNLEERNKTNKTWGS